MKDRVTAAATGPTGSDGATAVRGARWITGASLVIGVLNYAYALVLTRLLDVDAYTTFAAGQGLLLCAATVALVAIPWVLAQALARSTSAAEREAAVRFAVLISVVGGAVAGVAVAAVSAQFAGPDVVVLLGGVTLLIYVTRVTIGWLQGTERMRTLAGVTAGEAALKLVVGLLLVAAFGLGDLGALAAFGIGVAPFLIWWPRGRSRGGRRWSEMPANRALWRRALQLGTVQGLVAMTATIDLVLVALLPMAGSSIASYQVSVMVGRVPLFLASAIAVAFFPILSRRRRDTSLATAAVRMYLVAALPLTAVCATAPDALLGAVFPDGYQQMGALVLFTAISGFAVGAVSLVAMFFQADNDQSCLRPQVVGLVAFVAALLLGWRMGGVVGLAVGGACGTLVAMVLMVRLLIRRQGSAALRGLPFAEPLLITGVLIAVHTQPVLWLIAATGTGVLASIRFLRHRADVDAPTTAHSEGSTGPAGHPARDARTGGRRASRRLLVGVSGPDGVGKTSLVDKLVPLLRDSGYTVSTAHCYGCVFCRRFPGRPRFWRDADRRTVLGVWFDTAHAWFDAAEAAVRTAGACLGARTRGRDGRPRLVVTDRGPLDSLVKFDPPEGSATTALFRRLARRYDMTLSLSPGTEPGHCVRRANWTTRYERWGRTLPRTHELPTPGHDVRTATRSALALVRSHGDEPRTPATADGHRRRRVVISIFDDFGNPHYRGGGAAVMERVARRLDQDYDVTIVTAARHGGTRTRNGLRYHYVPVCRAGPRAGQLLFWATLPFLVRRVPHDLWLESFTPPLGTGFLPLFTRKPVIGVDQGGGAIRQKYRFLPSGAERAGVRHYRQIVVLNEPDAEEVRRRSPRAAVHVIENGVDPRHTDRSEFGTGTHITWLGRIDIRIKGLELLLEAYQLAAPALPLLVAGSGTAAEERKLERLLDETEGDVRWLGHVSGERKDRLLAESAFVVMPSRHETFGLVALEAMAHGKPVLHFELARLRWLSGKGDVAVPPFDVPRLAEEIGRLSRAEEERRRLGRAAYRAAGQYTWDRMTGRYRALVESVLADGRPAPSAPTPDAVPKAPEPLDPVPTGAKEAADHGR
ncbi:glycosyltransferase [Streptomyces sp. NA04227]|uniref:glycosyltransferase n=1 Tax=Streptomyces sp. NA04227 TaxID=2742136 RepID=UPI001591F676|nr:glycosyltransferase [Streptomyces sp. NA04227]QKW09735.1 glycosyltransferase [Streptomyces sp. NA04227]